MKHLDRLFFRAIDIALVLLIVVAWALNFLTSALALRELESAFENLRAASQRLSIVVPLCFAAIFALLYMALGGFIPALIVFSAVPMALAGVPPLVFAVVGLIDLRLPGAGLIATQAPAAATATVLARHVACGVWRKNEGPGLSTSCMPRCGGVEWPRVLRSRAVRPRRRSSPKRLL